MSAKKTFKMTLKQHRLLNALEQSDYAKNANQNNVNKIGEEHFERMFTLVFNNVEAVDEYTLKTIVEQFRKGIIDVIYEQKLKPFKMKVKKNPALPYLASAEHRTDGMLHVHILFPPYTTNDAINLKLDDIVNEMLMLEKNCDNQWFEFNLDKKVKNDLGLKPTKRLKEKIHRQLKLISYDIKRIDNGIVDQQPLTDYITKVDDSCIVMSHAFKNKIKHNNNNLNQIKGGTKEIGHWLFHSTVLKFIEDDDLQEFLKEQPEDYLTTINRKKRYEKQKDSN